MYVYRAFFSGGLVLLNADSMQKEAVLDMLHLFGSLRRMRHFVSWAILSLILTGCTESVLAPIGPVAESERIILLDSVAIMLVIVVPTIMATFAIAWWFRASNTRARRLPDWSYSGRLELIVWSSPALVVLFLGGIAWIGSHDLDPARPLDSKVKPMEVQVVSLDWKWLFVYPEQNVASVNRMVVPIGVPLRLYITSASVFNVFFVPRLGSQIYAMNGMTTQLNLEADEPGKYPGLSAHFSGDGFSGMAFDLEAMPIEQFNAWVTSAQAAGPVLDDAAYRKLLPQSENVKPTTYRMVQPELFDDIVRQKLPPGDGPVSQSDRGQINPAVSPREEK
jgi:cytochrome o ubiquinol oxidase subunit 2